MDFYLDKKFIDSIGREFFEELMNREDMKNYIKSQLQI
jgi:hypothetical protein